MENSECMMTDYPGLISLDCIKKITEQMENRICKVTAGIIKGTGFFTKIPFPDKNNMLPVFITNNHIINRDYLYEKDAKIQLDIKAENKIKVLNLNNRMKYTSDEKQYDTTIIEIKEEDDIKNFLELDDIIINGLIKNENKNKEFIDETIYIIQYPKHKLAISFGILKDIDLIQDYNFSHKCSTEEGSSGAPILNMNNKVIGIHKKRNDKFEKNYGTFLSYPIKFFNILNHNSYKRKQIKEANKPKIFKKQIIQASKKYNKLKINDKSKEKLQRLPPENIKKKKIEEINRNYLSNRFSLGRPTFSFNVKKLNEIKNKDDIGDELNKNTYNSRKNYYFKTIENFFIKNTKDNCDYKNLFFHN